jgi:mono/diheme cytochrome c family protein
MEPSARPRLVRYLGLWLVVGGLLSYAGYRWWEASLPQSVLGLFRGDSPLLPALASTRSLTLWALALALLLGTLLLVLLPRVGRIPVLVVVAIAAFTFFGGYERLREGTRKPFLIHSHLFSNGLAVDDIERINEEGMAAHSGWVALHVDDDAAYGRALFQAQCSSCHTLDGYQAIRPLLPSTADMLAVAADDPAGSGEQAFLRECASCHDDYSYADMREILPTAEEIRDDPEFVRELSAMMIAATLEKLRDMGEFYSSADRSRMIDTGQAEYPLMPPMVGNDADLERLAAYLSSLEGPGPEGDRVGRTGGE